MNQATIDQTRMNKTRMQLGSGGFNHGFGDNQGGGNKRRLRSVLLTVLIGVSLAFGQQSSAETLPLPIREYLAAYKLAWERARPLDLLRLGTRRANPFDSLVEHPRFDDVKEARVSLLDIHVDAHEGGQWTVELTKVHEELFWNGAHSRGVSRVRLRLISVAGEELPAAFEHRLTEPYAMFRRSTRDEATDVGEPSLQYGSGAWGFGTSNFDERLASAHRAFLADRCGTVSGDLVALSTDLDAAESEGYLFGPQVAMAQAAYLLALCESRRGERAHSLQALLRARTLHPDFPLALNELAARHFSSGELDMAIDLWTRSLRTWPLQPDVRHQLELALAAKLEYVDTEQRALLLSTHGMPPASAITVLKELLRRDKSNPETRRRLAAVHLRNHDPKSAEDILLETEYLHPSDPQTQYLLGRTYIAMDRIEDALQVFSRLWQHTPGWRDSLVYLAELNAYLRRFRTATSYLSEGLALAPDDPMVRFKLGMLAIKLGRRFEGLSQLRRARDVGPPVAVRRAILRQLE